MSSTPIDPGAGLQSAMDAVSSGVNTNLPIVTVVAGGLVALGVVWRLVRKTVKP